MQQPKVIKAPIRIRKRSRAGGYFVFERRYKPISAPDGSIIRDHGTIGSDVDPRYVWTVVDCEGKLYIVPGFATVNYVGRVLCDRPYSETEFECPGYKW
jgi:hypothetical protein